MGYRPLGDYAIIGNDDRCALVAGNGSIDWCCFPSVASPSVFGRLLDAEHGGHFSIEPTDTYTSEQQYRGHTNILETHFETAHGAITVTDFMPIGDDTQYRGYQRSIYRRVQGHHGIVRAEVDFAPRCEYAEAETTFTQANGRHTAAGGDQVLHLQTTSNTDLSQHGPRVTGWQMVTPETDEWFVVSHNHYHKLTPSDCQDIEKSTETYWQEWSEDLATRAGEIALETDWIAPIIRSALVLKLLINEGSGAIYAAATTSLPEDFGGDANWDYRYNWMRDAKFTVQALYNLGEIEEAQRYFEWFREISHDDPSTMQPVYGVHGEQELTEKTLDHLSGYRYATPVRIGNAAATQRQLDIYGAVVQCIYETLLHDEHLKEDDWEAVQSIVEYVCTVWQTQDAGIWEYRDALRHYVHSKLLCWVALDRGIKLARAHGKPIDTARWEAERARIRTSIESNGYSQHAQSFVQHYDTDNTIDASTLLIPIYGFLPGDDPRVEATIDTVMDELLMTNGLVKRNAGPDTREEGPGAFLFCSFWLVNALVLNDRLAEARDVFESVLEYIDPPYLLAERIDPHTGEMYGNFPQAFSHIGLVNSAIYLRCASGDHELAHDPLNSDWTLIPFRS